MIANVQLTRPRTHRGSAASQIYIQNWHQEARFGSDEMLLLFWVREHE